MNLDELQAIKDRLLQDIKTLRAACTQPGWRCLEPAKDAFQNAHHAIDSVMQDIRQADAEIEENFIAKWLIWSNEHRAWWRPSRAGYTVLLNEAGRYTTDDAQRICFDANRHLPISAPPYEMMIRAPEHE